MNTQELDRLLCERLGIKGDTEHNFDCDLETYDWGNPWRGDPPKCSCTPHINYPALSTTGDGMLTLEVALRAAKMGWVMYGNWRGVEAKVGNDFVSTAIDDSAPLALALATAAALGIEVPE